MNEQPKKWYHATWLLIVSILTVGPFAIPLVWANPHYSKNKKIIIIVFIVLLTVALTIASVETVKWGKAYIDEAMRTIQQGQ